MKFSYHDTVKWHDTDANRRVRPSQILTYMQEAANLQMAANSRNLDRLRDEEGLAFLLSRISIRIYSQLHAYDPFDSETWIVDGHGAASTRCFRILREGEVMAEGVSLWALMNIREHRLLRASAFDHGFPGDEAISLPELPVRFPVPAVQDMTLVGERHHCLLRPRLQRAHEQHALPRYALRFHRRNPVAAGGGTDDVLPA